MSGYRSYRADKIDAVRGPARKTILAWRPDAKGPASLARATR